MLVTSCLTTTRPPKSGVWLKCHMDLMGHSCMCNYGRTFSLSPELHAFFFACLGNQIDACIVSVAHSFLFHVVFWVGTRRLQFLFHYRLGAKPHRQLWAHWL
jgi:hypothetical protein